MDVDRNEENQPRMRVSSQSPKKMTKNYMSPTLSAASKAMTPKRKILAERNGASESISTDTHVKKLLIMEEYSETVTPVSPPTSKCIENVKGENFSDLCLPPYDPLKNYLSPRPQFLRYKPIRRCDIFLDKGFEETKDESSIRKSCSFDSSKGVDEEADSSSTTTKESSVNEGNEGNEEVEKIGNEIEDSDDDEEFEDFEEVKCWSFKGVVKTLFFVVLLAITSLFISSMNSSESLFKDDYYGVLNHSFNADIFKNLASGDLCFDTRQQLPLDLEKGKHGADESGILEEKMEEIYDDVEQVSNLQFEEFEAIEVFEGENKVATDGLEETAERQSEYTEVVDIKGNEAEEKSKDSLDDKSLILSEIKVLLSSDITHVVDEENEVVIIPIEETTNTESGREEMEEVGNFMEIAGEAETVESNMDNNVDAVTEYNWIKELLINQIETQVNVSVLIGIVLSSVIMASLVSMLKLKEKTNADSGLRSNLCSESAQVEQSKIIHKNTLPLSHSLKESGEEESYHSRTPTAEFLSEFVVREISYCTMSSAGMKSRAPEIEESSYSIDEAQSVSVQSQSMDSSSYGSYTAEKKLVKKQVRVVFGRTSLVFSFELLIF